VPAKEAEELLRRNEKRDADNPVDGKVRHEPSTQGAGHSGVPTQVLHQQLDPIRQFRTRHAIVGLGIVILIAHSSVLGLTLTLCDAIGGAGRDKLFVIYG